MVSVTDAERLMIESLNRLPTEQHFWDNAAGRVLRGAILADRDGPPFNRATFDGVCLRHADWAAGRREFAIAGMQRAGRPASAAPDEGACLEIMTGAVVPAPCDTVLKLEDFERDEAAGVVRARDGVVLECGAGVHLRASDFKAGDELVAPGCRLTAREMAVAAACGCTELVVNVQPKIAIVTTGDELVPVDDTPKAHEVRRSNDLAIRTVLETLGCRNFELNHMPDNRQVISWNLERLLQQADVIILTGGVSKGRFDYVPEVLEELGVKKVFHGVAQRPGRPMFFGTFARAGDFLHPDDTRAVAVFGLPGNPVSAFTCLHRYVTTAVEFMCGLEQLSTPDTVWLAHEVARLPELTHFVPTHVTPARDGRLMAEMKPCNTSGDFASMTGTDGLLEIPPGLETLPAGTPVSFFHWR